MTALRTRPVTHTCPITGKPGFTRRQAARAAAWCRREGWVSMIHARCHCGRWHVVVDNRKAASR